MQGKFWSAASMWEIQVSGNQSKYYFTKQSLWFICDGIYKQVWHMKNDN